MPGEPSISQKELEEAHKKKEEAENTIFQYHEDCFEINKQGLEKIIEKVLFGEIDDKTITELATFQKNILSEKVYNNKDLRQILFAIIIRLLTIVQKK